MKICVVGYGHFACVVAACLSKVGHQLSRFDYKPHLVREGQRAPELEPDYFKPDAKDVIDHRDLKDVIDHLDLVWIAYDAPLDPNGAPDVKDVTTRIRQLHLIFPETIPFLVSVQWPVGTMRTIALGKREWVYVLENVRVGNAISDFIAQPFAVLGVKDRGPDCGVMCLGPAVKQLRGDISCSHVVSWESAEMSKHALNAFMALQVAFINEIDRLGARYGANGADVSSAMFTDKRVSPHAYLKPGAPFGGGSLKRDLMVLNRLAAEAHLSTPILSAILPSNEG